MNQHCEGCVMHHNAKHPKPVKPGLVKWNDWCCRFGNHAKKVIGHCKNVGGKEPKP